MSPRNSRQRQREAPDQTDPLRDRRAVDVDVVAVEAHERVGIGWGDADAVVDYEPSEFAAVYEDHARSDVVRVVAGPAGEGRRRDEYSLVARWPCSAPKNF